MNETDEPEPAPPADDAPAEGTSTDAKAPEDTAKEDSGAASASDGAAEGATAEAPAKRKKKRVKKAEEGAAPDSFARYLAQLYVTEKGYRIGTVPEAAALAEASDFVLTYADGMSFGVLCIIDAERDPKRKFELSRGHLVEIGQACLHFTGNMNGTKLPVGIQIVEVRGEITAADKERLQALHRKPGFSEKVGVAGYALAPRTGETWSTPLLGWIQERWLRRALTAPRRSAEELNAPPPAIAEPNGPPFLTIGILAVLAALFVVELVVGARPGAGFLTPPLDTLVALGGASGALVFGRGEWWRLFTAPLLHAGPLHLILNGVGLFLGGVFLEGLLGRAWLAALFVVGGLGGSLASVLINDSTMVSVGASGAIMGLLAAAMVATYRLPPVQRIKVQTPLLQMLVPSLIPIALHSAGGHIDFAAHLGGALTGALAGFALLHTWPAADPHPRFRRAALGVALAGAAVYLIAFASVNSAYETYRGIGEIALIPNESLSSLTTKDVPELLSKYPRDPRSHQLAAIKAAQEGDLPLAEKHGRAGLAEEGVLRTSFPDRRLEGDLRSVLARVLEEQGRHAEAVEAARPVCDLAIAGLEKLCH